MPLPLLPTTLVGSYPQPDWLIDREKLSKQVPRVQANLWLPARASLKPQDEATVLAIRDQERAGSTSSPTASSAAKAIPTVSPPPSTASTSPIPARRSTAAASRFRCRG
jgi:hypothetical protein